MDIYLHCFRKKWTRKSFLRNRTEDAKIFLYLKEPLLSYALFYFVSILVTSFPCWLVLLLRVLILHVDQRESCGKRSTPVSGLSLYVVLIQHASPVNSSGKRLSFVLSQRHLLNFLTVYHRAFRWGATFHQIYLLITSLYINPYCTQAKSCKARKAEKKKYNGKPSWKSAIEIPNAVNSQCDEKIFQRANVIKSPLTAVLLSSLKKHHAHRPYFPLAIPETPGI